MKAPFIALGAVKGAFMYLLSHGVPLSAPNRPASPTLRKPLSQPSTLRKWLSQRRHRRRDPTPDKCHPQVVTRGPRPGRPLATGLRHARTRHHRGGGGPAFRPA
ncbi:hypothetical protein DMH01_12365 [Amycolatopsis sp. WAC 04182]|nr:hypothetical protein DMH01_12365 [Amycolatopsis sp. WAC 04182]